MILFHVKNYLGTELNNRTNAPCTMDIFEGDKTMEKRDMTQVVTLKLIWVGVWGGVHIIFPRA